MNSEGENDHAVQITLIHGLEPAHIPLRQEVGPEHLDPLPNQTDLNTQHLRLNPLRHDHDIDRTLRPELPLLNHLVHTLQSPRNQENLAPPAADTTPITIIQVKNPIQRDPLIIIIEVIVKNHQGHSLDTENDTMAATLKSAIDAIVIHPVVKTAIENEPPQNKVSYQCKNDRTPSHQHYLPFENSLLHDLLNCG